MQLVQHTESRAVAERWRPRPWSILVPDDGVADLLAVEIELDVSLRRRCRWHPQHAVSVRLRVIGTRRGCSILVGVNNIAAADRAIPVVQCEAIGAGAVKFRDIRFPQTVLGGRAGA